MKFRDVLVVFYYHAGSLSAVLERKGFRKGGYLYKEQGNNPLEETHSLCDELTLACTKDRSPRKGEGRGGF